MNRILSSVLCFSTPLLLCSPASVLALPPPEDTPEEVLRTEIIIDARSPVDGKRLSAAEYAQLRASLQEGQPGRQLVNPELQHLIFLLQLSYPLRKIFPFLHF